MTKTVTFTQSLLVETEVTVEVPSDLTDEEVRALCEDFPVSVTVEGADDNTEEATLVGITVWSAVWQGDYDQLDNNK